MEKVLITGIDSFTGVHFKKYLEGFGYDVYGTSLLKSGDKRYQCDITKKEDVLRVIGSVKPSYLIHLSGISFAAHDNAQDFYTVNTIGAMHILEAFLELNLKPLKIILASSAAVYGNQGLEVLDESLCPKPANHYGASKYAMECLASEYFKSLPLIVARPFNYTGVGQAEHFLIPKIVQHYKENKKSIELGNLNVIREFNSIDFVCEVYKNLLVAKESSIVLNICSGQGIKLLDIIDMMNDIAGYTMKVKVNPAFVRKDEIKSLIGSTDNLFSVIDVSRQSRLGEVLLKMYRS